MLEANPALVPLVIRDILKETAHPVQGTDRERQGAGALSPGQAVARALAEQHSRAEVSPRLAPEGVTFSLHDHIATSVQVFGSWNDWQSPGIAAVSTEPGYWRTSPLNLTAGRYAYKLLLNGCRWLDDPNNPRKVPDGIGGLNSALVVPQGKDRSI
jgi:hypothetical protein